LRTALLACARGITAVNRRAFQLALCLVFIIVPVMLYEVVARYGFNAPTTWGMELAVMLFGPYFLLGGPYLLHLRGHVALDLVRQRLSPRWNRAFDLINFPIVIAFCAILLVYSVPAAWSAFQYGETSFSAWNPPIWPVKATVPIALLLMGLQALAEFIVLLVGDTPGAVEEVRA